MYITILVLNVTTVASSYSSLCWASQIRWQSDSDQTGPSLGFQMASQSSGQTWIPAWNVSGMKWNFLAKEIEPWSCQPRAGVWFVLAGCVEIHHKELQLFFRSDYHFFVIHMSNRICDQLMGPPNTPQPCFLLPTTVGFCVTTVNKRSWKSFVPRLSRKKICVRWRCRKAIREPFVFVRVPLKSDKWLLTFPSLLVTGLCLEDCSKFKLSTLIDISKES